MRYASIFLGGLLLSIQAIGACPQGVQAQDERWAALGKRLFLDRRLSVNGTLSCAMCHIPEQGFTQHDVPTPVGVNGQKVRRNAPTLLNVACRRLLFFDGREFTLENQVWSPLLNPREMGNLSIGTVLQRIRALDDYQHAFSQLFAEGVTVATVGKVIAAYERTLMAADSPFDRWYYGHDPRAMSRAARRGYEVFVRSGCPQCHLIGREAAQFTDDDFHNTGIGYARSMQTGIAAPFETVVLNDLGRYEVTGDPADRWKYRTPTLRNVALTAPYMHDGSLPSLQAVIRFYSKGGIPNDGLDARIEPLALSEAEIRQLVAFLEALTSAHVDTLVQDARLSPIGDY